MYGVNSKSYLDSILCILNNNMEIKICNKKQQLNFSK